MAHCEEEGKKGRKQFFFEKKNQKTFNPCGRRLAWAHGASRWPQ
jgi:hypothetical protein